MSELRIVEIGDKPFVKSAFPQETVFFSTASKARPSDVDSGSHDVTLRTLPLLRRLLHDRATTLVVCHPTYSAPWSWRGIARGVGHRRALRGDIDLIRMLGPQLLRGGATAPIAIVDHEDLPVINRNNFFLLDRCSRYFKRELPVDRWRLFFKTAHANLPTPRFRRLPWPARQLQKVRPISLGLPLGRAHPSPDSRGHKTTDLFFAGQMELSSWVRRSGFQEIMALRNSGIAVDLPDRPLSTAEYYERCAAAWLTWSPEGLGWDCFRHYEAPACGSVPVCNFPQIERHRPLQDGQHAIYYGVEPGGLSDCMKTALLDKGRLQRMAAAARAHVLAHHTPKALASYIVNETLGAGR